MLVIIYYHLYLRTGRERENK